MAQQESSLKVVASLKDELSPAFEQMRKNLGAGLRSMRAGFGQMADVAKGAGALVASVAGAGVGTWAATVHAAEAAKQMDVMSRQTGVATERLQAWQQVAVAGGMESDEFAEALRDMNIELSDAATGGKDELAQLLSHVGIAARDASGHIRGANEVFLEFADAVAAQKDPQIQLRMAISAFGEDTGTKLLPMLQRGSKGFRDMEAAVKASGNAVTQDQIDALQRFRASWEGVKVSASSASTSLLSTLAPALTSAADGASGVITEIRPLLQARMSAWATELSAAMAQIPCDAVTRKIGALIEGGDRLREEWGTTGSALAFIFDHIGEIAMVAFGAKAARGFWAFGQGALQAAQAIAPLGRVIVTLLGSTSPAGIAIKLLAAGAGLIAANWGTIGPVFDKAVDSVSAAFERFDLDKILEDFGKLRDYVSGIPQKILDSFAGIGDQIKRTLVGLVDKLPDWTKKMLGIDPLAVPVLTPEEPQGQQAQLPGASAAQAATSAGSFYSSPSTIDFDAARLTKTTEMRPAEAPQGRVDINVNNAPRSFEISGMKASGMTLGATMNYKQDTGRSFYGLSGGD